MEFIDHADGATHVSGGNIAANVDVAELGNAQSIERLRKSADWQIDLMDAVIVPADEKAVGAYSKWNRSG